MASQRKLTRYLVRRRKKRKQHPKTTLSHLHCHIRKKKQNKYFEKKGKLGTDTKMAARRINLVSLREDRTHNGDNISLMGKMDQSHYAFELLKTDHCGRSPHEPHYRCMGQKVHDQPQPAL